MLSQITTPRLSLRPLTSADVEPLLAILGDGETMRWYPKPYDREGVVRWIARNLESYRVNGFGLFGIENRFTGEFLGDCGPTVQEVEGQPHVELGWHVSRDHWGKGIAPEAGAVCRDWCWRNLHVDHLISLIRPENRRSWRVAEKLGMSVRRETMHADLLHFVYWIDRPVDWIQIPVADVCADLEGSESAGHRFVDPTLPDAGADQRKLQEPHLGVRLIAQQPEPLAGASRSRAPSPGGRHTPRPERPRHRRGGVFSSPW